MTPFLVTVAASDEGYLSVPMKMVGTLICFETEFYPLVPSYRNKASAADATCPLPYHRIQKAMLVLRKAAYPI
jgi:hypothetical protein